MPDVSLLIQSGYTPRKEWIERHFRVELEEKKEDGAAEEATTFDPQQDQDLFGSIFGGGQTASEGEETGLPGAEKDLQAAANVMEPPAGATPEESQSDAIGEPSAQEQISSEEEDSDTEMSDQEILALLGLTEEEPEKPFGSERITEDEAVEMDK
jgi:hypothetical protein